MAKDPRGYWRANKRLITVLLIIWAFVSFGMGIWLRPFFMGGKDHGADLGFWFAEQGSIYVFIAIIFFYAWRMNKLDREYGVDE